MVIGMNEYNKLRKKKQNFKEFLLSEPKFDDLEIERAIGKVREIDI